MSFQIFLLVGHLTNWTGHNLLTDNTLKKRTQDVLVTCLVIVSAGLKVSDQMVAHATKFFVVRLKNHVWSHLRALKTQVQCD